jgi:hypothetical protein
LTPATDEQTDKSFLAVCRGPLILALQRFDHFRCRFLDSPAILAIMKARTQEAGFQQEFGAKDAFKRGFFD